MNLAQSVVGVGDKSVCFGCGKETEFDFGTIKFTACDKLVKVKACAIETVIARAWSRESQIPNLALKSCGGITTPTCIC